MTTNLDIRTLSNKKPKFILIDNSITNTNGHHYQYAMYCLSKAEQFGFEPILVTNRRYLDHKVPWKTFPVYKYGFWASRDKSFTITLFSIFNNFSNYLKKKEFINFIKFRYSKLGLIWEIQTFVPEYMRNTIPTKNAIMFSKSYLLLGILLLSIPAKIYLAFKYNKTKNKLFVKFMTYFRTIVSILKAQTTDPITGSKRLDLRIEQFSKDTESLFRKLTITPSSMVFIPTAGTAEMLGSANFIKNSYIADISWHFLYRRNIFNGSRYSYNDQKENLRIIGNVFQHMTHHVANHKIFFYTDTDELTKQYNEMGIVTFHTLPIPHTHNNMEHKSDKSRIMVSYLGDARDEKGYHLLPLIIQDVWHDYIKTNKVVFRIQSNFNVEGGEPKSFIAKTQLDLLDKEKLHLITTPLSLEEYKELLLTSGIILLPYERLNYYARSSGILAEALSIGIPVLVPACSWLSRQFQKNVYLYQLQLKDNLKVIRLLEQKWMHWITLGNLKKPSIKNTSLFFGDYSSRSICELSIPKSATHCLLIFDFTGKDENSIVGGFIRMKTIKNITIANHSFILEQSDSFLHGTFFCKLDPACNKLLVEFYNPDSSNIIEITNIKIYFLQNPNPNINIPLSVIGTTFIDQNDITEKFRELIDNYEHYVSTAKQFSEKYYLSQNADVLIKKLISTSHTQLTRIN